MSRCTLPLLKVIPLPELVKLVQSRRAGGERLVLTNGCFDLLHRGHVRYLFAAAELGEILVIGLNSDESVRGLKEPGRPLVSQDERAEVLAGLACVDYVTVFDSPTAEDLVQALRPDFYVKGGDYTDHPPVEAVLAESLGGTFQALDLVPGTSTSELVRSIRLG